MGFLESFKGQNQDDLVVDIIQKGKSLFYVSRGENLLPVDVPYLPKSSTNERYDVINRADAKVITYANEMEAQSALNKVETDESYTEAIHDHLYIAVGDPTHSISEDKYFFRCVGCDSAVVLTCQTTDQTNAAEYWNTAISAYEDKSGTLVYSLLDIFLKLGTITTSQVIKDPLFKEMMQRVIISAPKSNPEYDFLRKKITQLDPSFDFNV